MPLVELGNPSPAVKSKFAPDAPVVTTVAIPEGNLMGADGGDSGVPLYGVVDGFDTAEAQAHFHDLGLDQVERVLSQDGRVFLVPGPNGDTSGVTHLPGHEALVALTHPLYGVVAQHFDPTGQQPSWVHSDNPELARQIAEFHGGIPIGKPANVEETHHTQAGPPGVVPGANAGIVATTLQAGLDSQFRQMFAGLGIAGVDGTASAVSQTSITGTAGMGTAAFVGGIVVFTTTAAYANIISHTDTVLTVDRMYDPHNPGGAAQTTPGATEKYVILPSAGPSIFCGISATGGAVAGTETTLAGEITTAGGGLIAKIVPVAHSAGSTSATLTPVFTANGTDSLPVTIAKARFGSSILAAFAMGQRYQDLLGTTAVLSLSGDQLTLTDTITLS